MSSKYLVVNPAKNIRHTAFIPSSKPETQRAIIAATLSTGESIIYNDLTMFRNRDYEKCMS